MDEIDSIGSSRIESGSGGDSEVQRTMLELLNQLDGFEATKNIKVSNRAYFTRVFDHYLSSTVGYRFSSLGYYGDESD